MLRHLRTGVIALSNGLDRLAGWAAMGFLVVLVVVVMIQVIARYVLNAPPAWTEEAARYAMIWAGLMGATLSFKRRFDPALFNGPKTATGTARGAALAVATGAVQALVVLVYLLPILWHSFYGPGMNPARSFLLRHSRMTAEAMDFSTVLVAVAVPLMAVFILIHLAARAVPRWPSAARWRSRSCR
ncbi:TRAP transporter small permease [Rhodobaculum claviforme]|uniref:TRAP transporter small permease protein n=1 Tax=Rhodobaculum claviforme TaxID=1549854 RepID=A0A934TIB5_9RHOB|nr:TRAP transporter small permease subunit [Rhodobaculum claviforme]MBK5926365.1 C4-dicarboxylate ABC transporter permease [Rhodobaculum claviforme]